MKEIFQSGWYPLVLLRATKRLNATPPQSLEALSPKDATAKVGIFEVFPSLSYDEDATSDEELDIPTTPDSQSEILKTLKEFHSQFTRLKFKWTKAFHEIDGSNLLVTTDIQQLTEALQNLAVTLGPPKAVEGFQFHNLWKAIHAIASWLKQSCLETNVIIQELSISGDTLQMTVDDMQCAQQQLAPTKGVQETLHKHEARFAKILPIFLNGQRSSNSSDLQDKIAQLEAQVASMEMQLQSFQDKALAQDFTPKLA